jgi:hypothetical protein
MFECPGVATRASKTVGDCGESPMNRCRSGFIEILRLLRVPLHWTLGRLVQAEIGSFIRDKPLSTRGQSCPTTLYYARKSGKLVWSILTTAATNIDISAKIRME